MKYYVYKATGLNNEIQADIDFNKNAFGTIKQSVMDVESVPDQQNQQVITSAKQEDDKVVLSALIRKCAEKINHYHVRKF